MKHIRRPKTDAFSAIKNIADHKRLLFTLLTVIALVGAISGLTAIRQVSAQFGQKPEIQSPVSLTGAAGQNNILALAVKKRPAKANFNRMFSATSQPARAAEQSEHIFCSDDDGEQNRRACGNSK